MDSYRIVTTRQILRGMYHNRGCGPVTSVVRDVLTLYPGKALSYKEIADAVWGGNYYGGPDDAENCIRAAVYKLRRDGMPIVSWHGLGYRYERKVDA